MVIGRKCHLERFKQLNRLNLALSFQDDAESNHGPEPVLALQSNSEEDLRLKKAATIGTALMVVNSHRALILLYVVIP
jgi:hypothetical protein